MTGAVVGLVVSAATASLESHIHLPLGSTYSPDTASTVLATVVGAMVALTGFVVTISVLVVQMATGTFSARYLRLWYRDRVLKAVLAWLAGTFTYSYSLLRRVHPDSVPDLGVSLAGVFVAVGLVLFLVFLDRFVHRLRPVAVATIVAEAGRRAARESSYGRLAGDASPPFAAPAGPALAVSTTTAGAIQAIDHRGLVRWAATHDCVVVLAHAVGDFVFSGEELAYVHHGATAPAGAERAVRGMVALGVERTIDQDTAFAIRIMVDVANKALSPAINDPTTATQMIDHIGAALLLLGRTKGLHGQVRLADPDGHTRVVVPHHRWEDYLALALTEIRQFGADSVQVLRRLQALLGELRESVRPEYVPAIEDEQVRLDATVAAHFGTTVDLDRAATPDRQGIGGSPPLG
jgi:uncharacterized membrane protein